MRGIDATLRSLGSGSYDIQIGPDGDVLTEDSLDTAILVSLLTDRRANQSEVPDPMKRRGWIGNELTPGQEIGSKLWLFDQARLSRTGLNEIEGAAIEALQWLVEDGIAVAISGARATVSGTGSVFLEVTIERSQSVTDKRLFELWNNTGR